MYTKINLKHGLKFDYVTFRTEITTSVELIFYSEDEKGTVTVHINMHISQYLLKIISLLLYLTV